MTHDPDLSKKTKKTCEKMSQNMYILANEPSLACFRLQEHVHKSAPQLEDKRNEMKRVQRGIQGTYYDLEYSISAIKAMHGCETNFQNIRELLKNSLFHKQQLDYEESVRMRVMAANSGTAGQTNTSTSQGVGKRTFQRFSGSFDLPSSFIPASIASVSSSASMEFKDLKQVLSNMASGSASPSPSPSPMTRPSRISSSLEANKINSVPQSGNSQTPSDRPVTLSNAELKRELKRTLKNENEAT